EPHRRRVELAGARTPPGRRRVQELVARHVGRREADAEVAYGAVVELRVEEPPAVAVAVLADPVVLELPRVEVRRESDPAAPGNAVGAEHRSRETGVAGTDAEEAVLGSALGRQRARVARADGVEHRLDGADATIRVRAGRDRDPAHRREEGMEEETGNGAQDRVGIGRNLRKCGGPAAGIRPCALRAVELHAGFFSRARRGVNSTTVEPRQLETPHDWRVWRSVPR